MKINKKTNNFIAMLGSRYGCHVDENTSQESFCTKDREKFPFSFK